MVWLWPSPRAPPSTAQLCVSSGCDAFQISNLSSNLPPSSGPLYPMPLSDISMKRTQKHHPAEYARNQGIVFVTLSLPPHSPGLSVHPQICIQACFLFLSLRTDTNTPTWSVRVSWRSPPHSFKPLSKLQLLRSFENTHLLSLLHSKDDF